MGVTGLWRLVEPTGRPVHLDSLRGRVLAVDISIWLYQMVKGYQDGKGAALSYSHLLGLFQRLCKLLYYGIRPIFVFDGCAPALKKQTIINRQNKKSQSRNDVDKIQRQLMEVITKHIAVKNSLTSNTITKVSTSPTKKMAVANEEDMFKLPIVSTEDSEVVSDSSEDESTDKESISSKYQIDLHTFDVKSDYFKSLSAREKHDLLTELKETRKDNSWGRIDELPTHSQDFSTYQMNRLLKRRQVQVSLEEAEKEIGGHCLSINELEILLNEDGIDTKIHSIPTRQIASNENSHFLLVNNIKEAMNQAIQKEATKNIQEKNDEPCTSSSSCQNNEKSVDVYDEDLEAAIKLSLQCPGEKIDLTSHKDDLGSSDDDYFTNENEIPKINATTKSDLGIAKAYMMEYSGLSEFEIGRILSNETKSSSKIQHAKRKEIQKSIEKIILDNEPVESEKQTEDCISFNKNNTECSEISVIDNDNENSKSIEKNAEPCIESFDLTVEKSDFNYDEDTSSTTSNDSFEEVPEIEEKPADDIFADVFTDESKFHILDNNILSQFKNKTDVSDTEKDKSAFVTNTEPLEIENPVDEVNLCEEDLIEESEVENSLSNVSPLPSTSSDITPINLKDSDDNMAGTSTTKTNRVPNEVVLLEMATEIEENLENQKNLLEREQNKLDRMGRNITDEMAKDAQNLLRLFGIPYVVAPTEAEAQCAFLESINLTDGTITDDSDIWLFGGKTVYRNFFNQQKHVMQYIDTNISQSFKLHREDLILFALLVGSDYTLGVTGVGPVTALEILAAFPRSKNEVVPPYTTLLQGLQKFRDWCSTKRNFTHSSLRSKLKNIKLGEEFPNSKVIEAYLHPEIERSNEPFSWGTPDIVALRDFAKEKFGWSREKTEEILNPVLKRINIKETQLSIKSYFNTEFKVDVAIEKMSKRVKNAVESMQTDPSNSGTLSQETQKKGKQPNEKKRVRKTGESKAKKKKNSNPENVNLGNETQNITEKALPSTENDIELVCQSQTVELVPQTQLNDSNSADMVFDLLKKGDENLLQKNTTIKSDKVILLPESRIKGENIPQREKDQNILFKNKMKAIELFRKSKKGPGFVNKRKVVAQPLKDEADLSESSDSD